MVLNCRISIGPVGFLSIAEVEIESSWRNFTDRAKIKLPRAMSYLDDGRPKKMTVPIRELIKTGDAVTIELGYNGSYVSEFTGYISRSPRPSFPYELECEDEMWQLKRERVSISMPRATIREILEAVAPGYEIDCPDEVYGKISLKDTTPLKVFDHLRKTAGLYTFFRGSRLVSGLVHSDPKISDTVANYVFGKNIINDRLQFISGTDIRTIIYATATAPNGVVTRASVGETGGNVIRRNLQGSYTKKQLEAQLLREYEQLRTTGGYDGELISFGFPYVVHGQTVRIKDDLYEQRDSEHFVDEVGVTFGPTTGYRRTMRISSAI
ncbi:hypothetical protein [Spongiimicrobium salis]|uniref:hypothetical protein n=1 Tax=Spongiimicrobium salis TaxID=1667022 RepID=UPI00374DE334